MLPPETIADQLRKFESLLTREFMKEDFSTAFTQIHSRDYQCLPSACA
jgi:hypothetical protein